MQCNATKTSSMTAQKLRSVVHQMHEVRKIFIDIYINESTLEEIVL